MLELCPFRDVKAAPKISMCFGWPPLVPIIYPSFSTEAKSIDNKQAPCHFVVLLRL